jgi:hypothetical protein
MSSESLKSLVVTDPNLVDPELDVSGLKTQTDTDPRLLASIADYPGVSYDPTQFSYLTDLNELFAYGLPAIDTPAAAVPPATGGGGGGSGDGGQATTSTTGTTGDSTTTPIIPIEPGTFTAESLDQSFAGEEGTATQPVSPPGQPIDPTGMLPQIPEVTVQDPTSMIPQLGSAEEKFTSEQNNILQNIFNQAGQTVDGALNQLSKISGSVVDFANKTVDIFGEKIDVGKTLAGLLINKIAGGPVSLVLSLLPKDTLEQSLSRNIVNELKAEKDYGFNMQAGNMNQDPFGRNPPAANYEQRLKDDLLGINQSGFQTAKFLEKKQEFAKDYFDKKAEKAGGVEVGEGTVLGPGEAPGDVVSLDDMLREQRDENIISGIEEADEESDMIKTKLADIYPQSFDADTFDDQVNLMDGIEFFTTTPPSETITPLEDDFSFYRVPSDVEKSALDTKFTLEDDIREQSPKLGIGIPFETDIKSYLRDEPERDTGLEKIRQEKLAAIDQDIIDRGGGDEIGTGGLDPDRGQQIDRGSSGEQDDIADLTESFLDPVTTGTGPPSTGFKPQSTYDTQLEDDRDVGGGGNQGGDRKIVCTMMNKSYGFGSFRNKIWLKHSKDLAPEYQKGYHKIFLPLVKLSKKNITLKKILEHIAVHRTIDIRQESRGKVHLLGRVYRKILEPICYWVGKHG